MGFGLVVLLTSPWGSPRGTPQDVPQGPPRGSPGVPPGDPPGGHPRGHPGGHPGDTPGEPTGGGLWGGVWWVCLGDTFGGHRDIFGTQKSTVWGSGGPPGPPESPGSRPFPLGVLPKPFLGSFRILSEPLVKRPGTLGAQWSRKWALGSQSRGIQVDSRMILRKSYFTIPSPPVFLVGLMWKKTKNTYPPPNPASTWS